MTLEKAIEKLTEIAKISLLRFDDGDKRAIQLGIEALKWRLHDEEKAPNWAATPLPGETKED